MGEIFREIVKNKPGCWCDPVTISIAPSKNKARIDHIIVINSTSSTKRIRVGLMTSEAEEDKNAIEDFINVEKDTPKSIETINLMKGDRIYATFTGAKEFSDLRLQVHGEYADT
jgi:hypothetical protein